MKPFLLLAAALFSLSTNSALARSDGRFLGVIGMVAITDRVMGQITDDDPQQLYRLMNVEEKHSNMGTGKTIKFADKKFTLQCTDRGGDVFVCSMIVKSGPQGTISPGMGLIRFVAMGEEAAELHKQFFSNQADGSVEYLASDRSVRIASDGKTFVAEYHRGQVK